MNALIPWLVSGHRQSDFLLVLLEDLQLVLQLLGGLEADGEEEEDVVDPGDDTLRLVSVKPGHALVRHHVVHREYQLPGLKVEGDCHLPGQGRHETLDVVAVDELLQCPLLGHHQRLAGPQQAGDDLRQEVRHLLG